MDDIGRSLGPVHRTYFEARMPAQEEKTGVVLVAVLDGTLVGAVWASWGPADEPEIRQHLGGVPLLYHFEICKEMRGQGIGTGLLRYAEQLLGDAGYTRVALGVDEGNIDARRLYERLGYVADQRLAGVRTEQDDPANPFGDPFDVLVHGLPSAVTPAAEPSVTSAA